MKKQIKKQVFFQTTEKLSIECLALRIVDTVEYDDIPIFIALLDKHCESWEITEHLIKHFKQIEIEYNKVFADEEKEDLSPKSLI